MLDTILEPVIECDHDRTCRQGAVATAMSKQPVKCNRYIPRYGQPVHLCDKSPWRDRVFPQAWVRPGRHLMVHEDWNTSFHCRASSALRASDSRQAIHIATDSAPAAGLHRSIDCNSAYISSSRRP